METSRGVMATFQHSKHTRSTGRRLRKYFSSHFAVTSLLSEPSNESVPCRGRCSLEDGASSSVRISSSRAGSTVSLLIADSVLKTPRLRCS
jgi:hypothetical protein